MLIHIPILMFRSALFVLPFLFSIVTAYSQDFSPVESGEKVLSELRKVSQETATIQANFKEEKQVSFLKDTQKSSGIFYYKKDDKMRWQQADPFDYIILINGNSIRVKDGKKEKDMSAANRMAGRIRDMMLSMVNGDFQKNSSFTTSCFQNDESYLVVLTPVNKRMKGIYDKINLTFSRKTLRLKELTFFEKGGDRSSMKFYNEKFNQVIDEELFRKL